MRPILVSSPFWTSYLINLTALNLHRITLHAWKVSVQNVQMRALMCSDTASTACLCIHSLVCQRSQEGRGVQYLQPGFMAVNIPILTCTHAVNPIVHPKCLQWTGLGAHIPMSPPFTTWLWVWPVVLLVMFVMTSHYYIRVSCPTLCPSHCECAIPLSTSCVCEAVMFIFMYVLKCWTVLYMQLPWRFA